MSKLEEISAYWDTRSEGYNKTIHDQMKTSYNYYYELLKNYMPTNNCQSLDLGCGPGFFSMILSDLGCKVNGIDCSKGMLDKACDNCKGCEFILGDVQQLPYEDNSFDYIVSRNVIWDLENPKQCYDEIKRVLKDDGVLLIMDGNHYLYYFNNDYLEAEKELNGLHPHNCYGVKTKVIDDIAYYLPLSKCERPHWDLNYLKSIGIKNLQSSVTYKEYGKKKVISDFVIVGEK